MSPKLDWATEIHSYGVSHESGLPGKNAVKPVHFLPLCPMSALTLSMLPGTTTFGCPLTSVTCGMVTRALGRLGVGPCPSSLCPGTLPVEDTSHQCAASLDFATQKELKVELILSHCQRVGVRQRARLGVE